MESAEAEIRNACEGRKKSRKEEQERNKGKYKVTNKDWQ
jgi:hypothetical protein